MRKYFPLILLLALVPVVYCFHINHNYSDEWNVSIGGSGGTINLTEIVDGDYIWINETVGTPAFVSHFNITVLESTTIPQYLSLYQWYFGNPAHVIELEYKNQSDMTWYLLGTIEAKAGYAFDNYSLVTLPHGVLFDSNLKAEFRITHVSPGNANHYLQIDYISLETIDEDETALSAWDINWLTTLIWLVLMAIGYLGRKPMVKLFSGVIGIILGLLLLETSSMVGIIVICLSFYLLYEGTEDQ